MCSLAGWVACALMKVYVSNSPLYQKYSVFVFKLCLPFESVFGLSSTEFKSGPSIKQPGPSPAKCGMGLGPGPLAV